MSIFTKIWSRIQSILKIVPGRIKDFAEQTQPIVNKIKQAIESDTAVLITELIPGEWDNALRQSLINVLSAVSVRLTNAPNDADALEDQLQDLINEIKDLPDALRNGAYAKLSAMLLAYRDDWKETQEALYDLYAQVIYIKGKQ